MKRPNIYCLLAGVAVWLLLATAVLAAPSEEQIAYWRQYRELTPADDARVVRVQAIFDRVVQAAGKGRVQPRLFMMQETPWGRALPMALPDGWIVLSKGVLDLCYRDPARGEDRVAFVLGHEIAHQLKDDFWHLKFFQTLEGAKAQHPRQQVPLAGMRERLRVLLKDERPSQELQADQHGIIYAALAGFNTQAIVADDPPVNFFRDVVCARDPQCLAADRAHPTHPAPEQRAEALKAHLRQVLDTVAVFEAGLWFYLAGAYPQALTAFEQFLMVFPSREVYHNLGVSHHQLALQAYRLWQGDTPPLPFQLSIAVEPVTPASQVYLRERTTVQRGTTTPIPPATLFQQHLEQAIGAYRQALELDPAYTPAATNVGGALLLRGVHTPGGTRRADVSEAVTVLQRALEHGPQTPQLLNTLGVALWYVESLRQSQDLRDAKAQLRLAQARAPEYAAPVWNLRHIAQAEQQPTQVHAYQRLYEQVTHQPSSAPQRDTPQAESLFGLAVGDLEQQVPAQWGVPTRHAFQHEGTVFLLATYPVGISTVSRDGELLMLVAQAGCRGSSAGGMTLGKTRHDLLTRYGPPARRVETTQGESWRYEAQRIAFQLRAGTIVSWLIY